jgi:2-haloacid dehalogenase
VSPAPSVALLDVNETLSDLAPLADRFEAVGAPAHLLPTWFASTLRDGIAVAATGEYADFQEVARAAARTLLAGVPRLERSPEEAADHILAGIAALSVHPDVPEGIGRLHRAGVRIATLTNGSASTARGLLERAGLEELVEANVAVSDIGRWKPAPEPYRHACRTLGVAEGDAVLIAAHPWDVHGAKHAGLRGAWLNRRGAPYPGMFTAPDLTAGDLPALVDLLVA